VISDKNQLNFLVNKEQPNQAQKVNNEEDNQLQIYKEELYFENHLINKIQESIKKVKIENQNNFQINTLKEENNQVDSNEQLQYGPLIQQLTVQNVELQTENRRLKEKISELQNKMQLDDCFNQKKKKII